MENDIQLPPERGAPSGEADFQSQTVCAGAASQRPEEPKRSGGSSAGAGSAGGRDVFAEPPTNEHDAVGWR